MSIRACRSMCTGHCHATTIPPKRHSRHRETRRSRRAEFVERYGCEEVAKLLSEDVEERTGGEVERAVARAVRRDGRFSCETGSVRQTEEGSGERCHAWCPRPPRALDSGRRRGIARRGRPRALRAAQSRCTHGESCAGHSPSTDLYAEAGLPAYWRLELQPAPHLITYTLEAEHYAAASTLAAGQLGELPAPFRCAWTRPS